MPIWLVLILADWYSKLSVVVRWKGSLSCSFHVKSGVRQGGTLSPALFNVFVNNVIDNVKDTKAGCTIDGFYIGIVMYADDILLLAPTVHGLQRMLDACSVYFKQQRLDFNVKKSCCLAFGTASKTIVEPMVLQDKQIDWVESFKYLGVSFSSGMRLVVNTMPMKRKFYASCNSILSKTTNFNEILRLQLVESNCLSFITYALPSLNLSQSQIDELNVAWNTMYRKIFGFNKWESVKLFIAGLGRLDYKHIRASLCVNFVKNNLFSNNRTFNFVLIRFCLTDFCDLCKQFNFNLDIWKLHSLPHAHIRSEIFNAFHDKAGLF